MSSEDLNLACSFMDLPFRLNFENLCRDCTLALTRFISDQPHPTVLRTYLVLSQTNVVEPTGVIWLYDQCENEQLTKPERTTQYNLSRGNKYTVYITSFLIFSEPYERVMSEDIISKPCNINITHQNTLPASKF